MTKTMAEVLADHRLDTVLYLITEPEYRCICGKRSMNHDEHQASALSAAGFGLVSDAGAKALEDAADAIDADPYDDLDPFYVGWLKDRAEKIREGE